MKKNVNNLASQLADLQEKEDRLEEYEKLLGKAIHIRYGIDPKVLEKMVKNAAEFDAFLEIKKYFKLKTEQDIKFFREVMCNDRSLQYFERHLPGADSTDQKA